MRRFSYLKKPKSFWLVTFIVFCLVFFSHDTMMFGQNSNSLFMSIGKVVPLAISVLLLVMNINKGLSLKNVLFAFSIIALQLLSCLVHNESLRNYVFVASVILAAFLLASFYSFALIKQCFINIIFALSLYSLIIWIICSLFPSFINFLPKSVNSNGMVFPNAMFSLIEYSARTNTFRNTSVFREPGVYAIYLSIAMIFSLSNSKNNYKYLIVFILTILTTFSTAGYILLGLLLVYFLLFKIQTKYKTPILLLLTLLVIVFSLTTDYLSLQGPLFSKFDSSSDAYGSFYARLQSIRANFNIFLSNPLFGIGRYGLYDLKVLGIEGLNDRFIAVDNTNTILIGFASYGLLYGILTITGLYLHCFNNSKRLLPSLCFFLILIMSLSNEDITQNPLLYIMIFDGLFNFKSIFWSAAFNENETLRNY